MTETKTPDTKISVTRTLIDGGLRPPQSILATYKPVSSSIAAAALKTGEDVFRMARVSPVDGRYAAKNKDIAPYVCEAQLARFRIMVEAEWFRNLFLEVLPPDFTQGHESLVIELAQKLKAFADDLPIESAIEISKQEERFKHDVIAMITVVRNHLEASVPTEAGRDVLLNFLSMIHLGLTSEDVSSTSHSLMIYSTVRDIIKPACDTLVEKLLAKAQEFSDVPDPNFPTASLGSRYASYAHRIAHVATKVVEPDYLAVKFSGATGTHAAMGVIAADSVDVLGVAKRFISTIAPELVYLPVTVQINPHDDLALWCGQVDKLRSCLQEICWDIWEDSGRDVVVDGGLVKLLSITPDGDQSGSSAMPQKIQVILVENGIGTAMCAGGLAKEFAGTVNVNRLQRELSDSRIIREIFGVLLPEILQIFQNIATDVPKLQVNAECRPEKFKESSPHRFEVLPPSTTEVASPAAILGSLSTAFKKAAKRLAGAHFLARTHNQPASPTTFGKELRVFGQRLEYLEAVLRRDLFGKPSSHVWEPADVVAVARGVLYQFFDDVRIYVKQRNGAVALEDPKLLNLDDQAALEAFIDLSLKDPARLATFLDGICVDSSLAERELEAHFESLGEAVQTVLRRYGVWDAYDRVKRVTRGATMDQSAYKTMVKELLSEEPVKTLVPNDVQEWLLELKPQGFTGAAEQLAMLC